MSHTKEWKLNWKKPIIDHGKFTEYNYLVHYPEGLVLGNYIDISQFVYLQCKYGIVIGDDVEIGMFTAVLSESTIDNKKGKIIIKKNAKIGTHSTIMPNVIIGENSVVGAHSMVKSGTVIPDNEVWFGVPSKKQKDLK